MGFLSEIVSLLHWISLVYALDSWAKMTSTHGFMSGTLLFLLVSLITGVIAEAIESRIPTILRPIRKLITAIIDLLF